MINDNKLKRKSMPTPKKRYLDSTPAVTKQQLAKTNKHSKSGIPVTYFTQSDAMPLLTDNPNRTAVLDEVTVRPYKKLPMQSELFQGITNQVANEKADEYVNRVTPTAEDLLNIGTLGGLNNLSPTQWARRAYDLREAIKGNMSWDKFGNNWFYGNKGLVSDKYAQEHPYSSAAINLAGDIGAFGTFSALRRLPKYTTLMEAENKAAQEAAALNWRDMLSNNVKRTRIGDVEIDNPNLLYHLDRGNNTGAFSNHGAYVKNGILFPGVAKKEGQLDYSWWNKGKPYATSVNGEPMTRLMTATKDTPGMLHVRSQNYPIGQWTGSKGFVLPSEYVNPEGVNVSESIYALEPTYGWRRVRENTPTLNWTNTTRTPQITAENAASMTPKQWTAAQDAAIARGDMKEARRLKKLYDKVSAKKANLSLYSNLRHDTNSDIWNVFDESKFGSATDDGWFGKGLYLTANPKQIVKGNNHMRLNVFMKKPFFVDKNGDPDRWIVARNFNRGKTYDDWIKENSFSEKEIEGFFSEFKNNPFGITEGKEATHLKKDIVRENKLRKLFDEMNSSDGVIVSTPKVNLDEVVAPNGRFIKSADVVTYDDNGIRIGLGERNNFKLNDNRYSWLPWFLGGSTAATLYNKSK